MESGELETTGSPELTSPAPDPLWRRLGHGALARLLDIVTPPLCLACHTPLASHNSLCPSCWSRIDFIRTPLCDRLGIPLPYDSGMGTLSAQAIANPPEYGRARCVARYDGVMRQLIHDRKFRDRHDATALFGRWLAIAGQELIAGADVLVPVPLHRLKLLKRRFNQAAILSAELACQTGVPHAPLALVRTRATQSQIGLSLTQRQQNLKGAFAVPRRWMSTIESRRVLLIDDVVTTGATASAAARSLYAAGALSVDVLALACVTDTAATLTA